jgi:hypothetical protein
MNLGAKVGKKFCNNPNPMRVLFWSVYVIQRVTGTCRYCMIPHFHQILGSTLYSYLLLTSHGLWARHPIINREASIYTKQPRCRHSSFQYRRVRHSTRIPCPFALKTPVDTRLSRYLSPSSRYQVSQHSINSASKLLLLAHTGSWRRWNISGLRQPQSVALFFRSSPHQY